MLSFHCKKCEYDLCYKCILEHDYRVVNKKMENHATKGKKYMLLNMNMVYF